MGLGNVSPVCCLDSPITWAFITASRSRRAPCKTKDKLRKAVTARMTAIEKNSGRVKAFFKGAEMHMSSDRTLLPNQ
jgi:hypothetical protein